MSWNNVFAVLARIIALGLGGFMAYCEVTGTYEYYLADQGTLNYIVKATVGVTLFTALAPMFISMAYRARQPMVGTGLLVALPVAIILVFGAAVSRTGGSADHQEQQRIDAERALRLAQKTEEEATQALTDARNEAVKECNTGGGTGRGHKCDEAEGRRDEAQRTLDRARAALKNVSVARKDPWASRVALITSGRISEEDVRMYWPVLMPVVVSLVAGLLMAFGAHLGLTSKTKPVKAVVVESKRAPFKREPLRLVASNNTLLSKILDFMCADLKRCTGSRTSEADVYRAYAGRDPTAVTPEEFVPVFDRACAESGIQRESVGGMVYLRDIRIVESSERQHG